MSSNDDFWKIRLSEWTTLEKPERITEALFGLIMVLTFTCTISVSNAGKQEVRELLYAAVSCNLAWGLVDSIMYLMGQLINRVHYVTQLKRIRQARKASEWRDIIREKISPLMSEMLEDEDIDRLAEKVRKLPALHPKKTLVLKNLVVAAQIFLLVFLVSFPVTLPFIFITDVTLALRVSNGIALLLLAMGGYSLGKYSGMRPFRTAIAYAAIGAALVVLAIALGG
jgi:hypothetical protein